MGDDELRNRLIGIGLFVLGVVVALLIYQSSKPSHPGAAVRPTSYESLSDAQSFCTDGLKGSLEAIDADGHDAWIWFWKGIVEGYNLHNCQASIDDYLSSPTIQVPQTPQTFVVTLGTGVVTLTAP